MILAGLAVLILFVALIGTVYGYITRVHGCLLVAVAVFVFLRSMDKSLLHILGGL